MACLRYSTICYRTESCKDINIQDIDTELVLLFSHDANILYLQRLLDLNWIPDSYPENVAVPGGLLAFDLWKDQGDTESYFVSVSKHIIG